MYFVFVYFVFVYLCILYLCIFMGEKSIIAISVTAAMSVSLGGPWAAAGQRACAKSGIK